MYTNNIIKDNKNQIIHADKIYKTSVGHYQYMYKRHYTLKPIIRKRLYDYWTQSMRQLDTTLKRFLKNGVNLNMWYTRNWQNSFSNSRFIGLYRSYLLGKHKSCLSFFCAGSPTVPKKRKQRKEARKKHTDLAWALTPPSTPRVI